MVSNERAEQLREIFRYGRGDVKFIAAKRVTNEELQNHLEASAEVKDAIRQEFTLRRATQTPGRMPELVRYFERNREQFGNPEIGALNRAPDLTWNAQGPIRLPNPGI